jgi:3-dehydroquinate dehydratase-1
MEAHVRLRSVDIGRGLPKICVPLVAESLDELRAVMGRLVPADSDLVELRLDLIAGSATDLGLVREAIAMVRGALPDGMPLLATYRTPREGGTQPITGAQYAQLLAAAVATGHIDALDAELLTDPAELAAVIATAHGAGVVVVVSNHDFIATPGREEIVSRLRAAQDLGADIVKIAVMPESARDVVTLLDATAEFTAEHARVPAITMSMGELGVISRIGGGVFGSAVSFGSAGTASAPGQVDARSLRGLLVAVHGEAEAGATAPM